MNVVAIVKTLALSALMLAPPVALADRDFEAVDGPNVRVLWHDDQSRSVFLRSTDQRVLTKKTFNPNGVLTLLTRYTMDAHGNLIGCKIFDGQKQELFKVNYGYDKNSGQLVAEHMFDSRVKRRDANGTETPVRIVRYTYDAKGNRSAPIIFTTLPGRSAKEVFGADPSAPEQNLFNENGGMPLANPRAHRAGNR